MNASEMPGPRAVVSLATALCDEYRAIHGEDVPLATENSPDTVEQNIEISFSPAISIGSRTSPAEPPLNYAFAKIFYPEGTGGELIYLKPTYLRPGVPIDVRANGATGAASPQEPTVEQWFSQSQFESYRRLGDYRMSCLCQQKCETMAGFFDEVLSQLHEAHGVPPLARERGPVEAAICGSD
jgi:hypothetical protein